MRAHERRDKKQRQDHTHLPLPLDITALRAKFPTHDSSGTHSNHVQTTAKEAQDARDFISGFQKLLPLLQRGQVSLPSKTVGSINDLVMTVRACTEMGTLEISPPPADALEKTW